MCQWFNVSINNCEICPALSLYISESELIVFCTTYQSRLLQEILEPKLFQSFLPCHESETLFLIVASNAEILVIASSWY